MSKFKENKSHQKSTKKIFGDLLPGAKKNFINGVFLIDGNHTFLHCLESNQKRISELKNQVETKSKEERAEAFRNDFIRHRKKQYKKDPESAQKDTERMVDRLYKDKDFDVERIERLQRYQGDDIAPYFSEDLFVFQQEFKNLYIESIGLDPEDTDLNYDSFIFDANLPPIQQIICYASDHKDKALKNNNIHEVKLMEGYIQDLKNGLIDFYKEGSYIKAPYTSKKSYLDFLELDALIGDRTEIILGTKYVNWRNSKTTMYEKGVDTNLVIKGVEYANDPDTKFICLISSDTDFVPLIEYIQFNNKKVFLLSLNDIKNVTLKKAVGGNNFFNLDHELFKLAKLDAHYDEEVLYAKLDKLRQEDVFNSSEFKKRQR